MQSESYIGLVQSIAASQRPPTSDPARVKQALTGRDVQQLAGAHALLAHCHTCALESRKTDDNSFGAVEPRAVYAGLAHLLQQRHYMPVKLAQAQQRGIKRAVEQSSVEPLVPQVRATPAVKQPMLLTLKGQDIHADPRTVQPGHAPPAAWHV